MWECNDCEYEDNEKERKKENLQDKVCNTIEKDKEAKQRLIEALTREGNSKL